MARWSTWAVWSAASCFSLLAGCSSNPKQHMAALEAQNRNLHDQLNRCRSDVTTFQQSRDESNRRLAESMRDADALRAQLAGMPASEPTPSGWTAVPGGGMIAIEDDVLFSPGKVALLHDARRTLDRVVSTLQGEYGDKDIFVFGHTDDQPIRKSGWQDNWQLSAERALAVVRYLHERGVSPARLVASGCGEFRARQDNSSASNRAANRRVEIFAIDPSLSTGRR